MVLEAGAESGEVGAGGGDVAVVEGVSLTSRVTTVIVTEVVEVAAGLCEVEVEELPEVQRLLHDEAEAAVPRHHRHLLHLPRYDQSGRSRTMSLRVSGAQLSIGRLLTVSLGFFNDDAPQAPARVAPRPPLPPTRSLPVPAVPPPPPRPAARPPVSRGAVEVKCDCQAPAGMRTVQKDTGNKGRQFYTCGKDGACSFFQWVDEPVASSSRAPTLPSRSRTLPTAPTTSGNHVDPDDKVCQCDPPARAAFREVQKDGPNKGRHFYACRKPQGSQCGFFEWADEGDAPPQPAGGNDRNCFKVHGYFDSWSMTLIFL